MYRLNKFFEFVLVFLLTTALCAQVDLGTRNFTPASGGGSPTWAITNTSSYVDSTFTAPGWSTAPMSSSLTPGSIILVAISSGQYQGTYVVTDTAGNSYADAGSGLVANSTLVAAQIFCAHNSSTTASNVVNVNGGYTGGWDSVVAIEITGDNNSCSSVIDAFAAQAASSTISPNNVTSTVATTTASGDFVFGFFTYCLFGGCYTATTVGTSPNLFTAVSTSPAITALAEYFIQPSAGSIAAVGSNATSAVPYVGMMVALK